MKFIHGLVLVVPALLSTNQNGVQAATCGGGIVGDGICADSTLCCSQYGWCGSSSAHCGGSSCGGGNIGNGVCADSSLCCSQYGWCGSSAEHCSGNPPPPTPATPTMPPPAPTNPTPTAPVVPVGDNDDNRLIAYLGNWQPCPSAQVTDAYTHIMISFAVSYTWAPSKNICSTTCQIATPPVCNNAPNDQLIAQWKAAGKKVLLSFGGAGMGGSWAGDNNNCWDYCYGRETEVINRLAQIVDEMDLDGVDIDYEYFYNTEAQQKFLTDVTVGLRNTLPAGSIITHAPMDSDLVYDTGYYNVLKNVAWALDFLCPQYYNGFTRPAIDGFMNSGAGSISAYSHYSTLVNDMFGGDATKIVFGFCISDCSGTGSNANANQAVTVMSDVRSEYPCNGGAFFWVSTHDVNGDWSSTVDTAISPDRGCSASNPPPTNPPPTNPPPTNPPPTNPPPTNPPPTNPPPTNPPPTNPPPTNPPPTNPPPTNPPPTNSPPTNPPPTNPPPTNPPPTNPPPTNPPPTNPPPTNPPPTNPPPTNPPPTNPPPTPAPSMCCPSGYTGLRPHNECQSYFHCVNGEVTGPVYDCAAGTVFDFNIQNCNWEYLVTTCTAPSCDGNPPPTNPPPTNPPPTPAPPTNPPPTNPPPTPAPPTPAPSMCCPYGYTGLRPHNECQSYFHCVNGEVTGSPLSCPGGTLFDVGYQFCNWDYAVTCTPLSCCNDTGGLCKTGSDCCSGTCTGKRRNKSCA